MKVTLKQSVFDAQVWEPVMADNGQPVWGQTPHNIHQASHNMTAVGLIMQPGPLNARMVYTGDVLVFGSDGSILEVMAPMAFHDKYEEVKSEEESSEKAQEIQSEVSSGLQGVSKASDEAGYDEAPANPRNPKRSRF